MVNICLACNTTTDSDFLSGEGGRGDGVARSYVGTFAQFKYRRRLCGFPSKTCLFCGLKVLDGSVKLPEIFERRLV
jgi:hypothetical protein